MQPHTGAAVAAIIYLTPSIRSFPESFEGRTFDIRTTIYSSSGHFLYYKYHSLKTNRHNTKSMVLEFEVGKDYICYLEVRYDLAFENFSFIKHRHTYTREEFTIYPRSENFSGEYISDVGDWHRIEGRKLSPKKLQFYDSFKDDKNPHGVRLKYDCEILRVM